MTAYLVLYVDDEPELLNLGKIFLEMQDDFKVEIAHSVQESLDTGRLSRYDCIVSDYQMPETDGLTFLKMVRSDYGTLPFILFTGKGREEVVIEAINSGVDFYLQKGGSPKAQFAELAHKIRMAVGRKRAVDELIASENRLSTLFHASPIHQMITEYDTGKIIDINDRFLHDLKLPRSDVIGRTQNDIGLFIDAEQMKAMYSRLDQTGIVRNVPVIIHNRAGKLFTSLTSLTKVHVHGKDLVYTHSVDISEQAKARQTITALLNAPPDVSLLLDTNGVILAVNHAATVRYNLSEKELIGRSAYPLVSPELGDLRREQIGKAIHTQKPLVYIDDRTGRTYENHLYPVLDSDRNVTAVAVYSRDVTEEVQARKALRESEEKYRLLVEHSHDGVYIYRDNSFLFINRQAELITGYSHDEMMKQNIWDMIHPDDRGRLQKSAARRLSGERVSSAFYSRFLTKDGSVRYGEFYVDVVEFLGKRSIFGIFRDITERKLAQEKVEEQALQLSSLSNNLPSGMVYQVITKPGEERHFAFVSAGVKSLFEVSPEEVSNDPFVLYNQILPEDRANFIRTEETALATLSFFRYEAQVCTPSGIRRWVHFRSAPRKTPAGDIIWDGIALDVTAAKESEMELKAAYERIASSEEELRSQYDELSATQVRIAESEEKYRALVDHSQDGVFIAQDENLVFINRTYAAMAGYSVEELLGQPFRILVAPEDREKVVSHYRERISGKITPETYEFFMLHKDQKTRIHVKINVGRGMYNGHPAVIGTLRNITEERRHEKALLESEELHRKMIAALPDIIVRADLEGNIIYINNNGLQLAGVRDPQEILGSNMFSFFAPESLAAARENARLMFERPLGPKEYTIIIGNGQRIPVEVNGDILRSPDGVPYGSVYIIRDIRDRRRSEEALRKSEEKYRTIVETIQDVFYRTDRNGTITMISPYGARLVGYTSPEEIIGKLTASDFYADPHERNDLMRTLLEQKAVTGYPLTLKDRAGILHYATANSHVLSDPDGNFDGVEGTLHDITDLIKTEQALRQANRQISLVTSITRHDIRNQLAALSAYLELAQHSVKDPEKMEQIIAKEQQIAAVIGQQISFTYDFEDMGAKNPSWNPLIPLVQKAFGEIALRAEVRVQEDLPDVELFADPLLPKVFYNLIDNANRYGGAAMTLIRISATRSGENLDIVIEDNGIGIPPEDKSRIFDRGYGKNTGLGLFLVREILAITGMTIHETGNPGSGARFVVSVPHDMFRSRKSESR